MPHALSHRCCCGRATKQAAREREQQQEQQQARAKLRAQQEARKQADESEAAQAKQWILSQYMQRDSDSDMEEDHACSSGSSIHEWQLYGGQQEQEAGRAAQARAKMDPEARRRLVAQDMAAARAEAAAAKAAGDAARQRAAGQSIGKLKQEMKSLGSSDDERSFSGFERRKMMYMTEEENTHVANNCSMRTTKSTTKRTKALNHLFFLHRGWR